MDQPHRNWDKVRAPTGGSSGESWAMDESLTQWEYMHDEGAQFSVKCFRVMKKTSVVTVRSAGQLRASSRGKTEGAGVIRFDWV